MYAKLKKCEFWLKEVSFLGHVVFDQGTSVDPAKIESDYELAATANSTRSSKFLGSD